MGDYFKFPNQRVVDFEGSPPFRFTNRFAFLIHDSNQMAMAKFDSGENPIKTWLKILEDTLETKVKKQGFLFERRFDKYFVFRRASPYVGISFKFAPHDYTILPNQWDINNVDPTCIGFVPIIKIAGLSRKDNVFRLVYNVQTLTVFQNLPPPY